MKFRLALATFLLAIGVSNAQLSGNYTIDRNSAASSTNFQSMDSAFKALSAYGVNSSVTMNVVANSGPYYGRAILDTIPGTSSSNTVTFNGNGNVFADSGTSTLYYLYLIRGADYVTFDSLTIQLLGPAYGSGFHVMNGSDHLTVNNCLFDVSNFTSFLNYSSAAIVYSMSEDNMNYNGNTGSFGTFTNNRILGNTNGSLYGIYLNGNPSSHNKGFVIENNEFRDIHHRSLYFRYIDSSLIRNNEFHRPNIVSTSTVYFISFNNGSVANRIERNRIHNSHGGGLTSTIDGISIVNCSADTGSENIIINNLIYNLQSDQSIYGIYNYQSSGAHYYYNTISIPDVNTETGKIGRGFMQNGTASNIVFRNNLISMDHRSSGTKYGIYFTTAASNIVSEDNIIWVDTTNTDQWVGRYVSNTYGLGGWQAVNSNAYDQNTISIDPFLTDIYLDPTPSSALADNTCPPVSGISTDFYSSTRDALTPDAGAIEFSAAGLDAALTNIYGLVNICPSSSPVSARIVNVGDSTLDSVQINWTVNGTLQSPVTYVGALNTNDTANVLLGNVSVAGGVDYDLKAWTSQPNGLADQNPLNDTMEVFGRGAGLVGTYTIGSSGDFSSPSQAAQALMDRGMCGSVVFNVDSASGPYYGQIRMQDISGNNDTATITFNGNGATTIYNTNTSFKSVWSLRYVRYCTIDNFNVIANSSGYSIGFYLSDSSDYNVISNCDIELRQSDQFELSAGIIAASHSSMYSGGNHASYCTFENNFIHGPGSGSAGPYNGIKLYGSANGLDAYDNIIRNNRIEDFFYCGITVYDQNGLNIENNEIYREYRTSSFTGAYGIYVRNKSLNVIIQKNYLHDFFPFTASNSSWGIAITGGDAPSSSPNRIENNLIVDENGGSSSSYGFLNNGADNCHYYHNTVVINHNGPSGILRGIRIIGAVAGNQFHNNIFTMSGGSSRIGLEFNSNSSTITSDRNVLHIVNGQVGKWGSSNYSSLTNWQSANSGSFDQNSEDDDPVFDTASIDLYVPTSLAINNMCTPISGITDDYYGRTRDPNTPDPGFVEFPRSFNEAEVLDLFGLENPCPGNIPLVVRVVNNGIDTIQSLKVNWTVNGVAQTTFNYTSPIPSADTADISFGSFMMNNTSSYDIVVWTSEPSGNPDSKPFNDTIKDLNRYSSMTGTYIVGTTGNYSTVRSIMDALNSRGVCGAVVVNVDSTSGPYTGRHILGPVAGNDNINTITFNGNGAVVSHATTSSQRYVMLLNGVDYTTIRDFNILASGSSYGGGIILSDRADHNLIEGNVVEIYANSQYAFNACGICSSSNPNYDLSEIGDNANYTTVQNNIVKGTSTGGPYYGISFKGPFNGYAKGNVIKDNIITDQYYGGVEIVWCDSTLISGNDVSRPTRQSHSFFVGVSLGVGNINSRIEKNRWHHTSGPSSLFMWVYGVRNAATAPVGQENIITNNILYKVNGTGHVYGVYNNICAGAKVYNNTFSIDDTSANASSTRIAAGVMVTQYANRIDAKNNIASITRGGSATNYGIYIEDTAADILSEHNVFYINGGGSNHYGHYNGTDYTRYSDWRAANNSVYDQFSADVDPQFVSIPFDDYLPQNPIAEGIALPLSEVSDDIFGTSRPASNPDPGAIEFSGGSVPNDFCSGAILVDTGLTVGNTKNAMADFAPTCVLGNSSSGVWYEYDANGGYVTASLCGSTYDTRIRVYEGACNNFTCVTGNDDSCSTQSYVGWCSDTTTYFILVHGTADSGLFYLNIEENAIQNAVVSFVGSDNFCDGDSVEITSTKANSYLWSNGKTSQKIWIFNDQSYSVNVFDTLGCEAGSNQISATVFDRPQFDLGNDSVLCLETNDSILLDAGIWNHYLWSTGDTTQTIWVKASVLGSGKHIITAAVTDNNNCIGSDEIELEVKNCFDGILENQSSNIKMYPNPTKSDLILESEENLNGNIQVYSLDGSTVFIQTELNGRRSVLDVSELSSGMYFVQIEADGKVVRLRFVKER